MKNVKLIIALFITTALIFSCKPKNQKQGDVVVTPTPTKKDLSEVLTSSEIASLTASLGNSAAKGKPVKLSQTVTVKAASSMTLMNNGGGSFSINFGGATDVLSQIFRGGDSLSSVSGNVYGTASLQYDASITSWTATFTKTYYQSIVITGSKTPDANGVIGADWVFVYTNVTQ